MAGLRLETSASFDRLRQTQKPLPPTPRRPSSDYTVSPYIVSPESLYEQDIPYDRRIVDEYLPNEYMYLQPKTYRASTSDVPDPVPPRPKLLQLAQSHIVPGPPMERGRVNLIQSNDRDISPCTPEGEHGGISIYRPPEDKDAEWHAKDFESVLPTRNSVWHATVPDQYFPIHGNKAPRMSSRITDIVDYSLAPTPLSSSITEKVPEPESRFSSDSSEASSPRGSLRDSFKKTARKAFPNHKDADSQRLAPPKKPKSRLGSDSSGGRISLQLGIEDMYDTLTSFYSSSPKSRPATPKPATPGPVTPKPTTPKPTIPKPAPRGFSKPLEGHRPNQHRTPAIPLSDYQKLGPKAWDTASHSSKTSRLSCFSLSDSDDKEPKSHPISRNRSQGRKKPSLANRLASTLQNGTEKIEQAMGLETNNIKRTRSQKKREELKKKIVIVGLGDREQAGGGRWL